MALLRRLLTCIVAFFLTLIDWLSYQIRLLFTYFNPIKIDAQHLTFTRLSFLPAFLYLAFLYLWGLYGLGPELAFNRACDLDYYQTDAYIYYHQLNAPQFWPILDFLGVLNAIRTLLVFACTFACRPLSAEACLCLPKETQQTGEMTQMGAFQRTERTLLKRTITLWVTLNYLLAYKYIYDKPTKEGNTRALGFLIFAHLAAYYSLFTNIFLILYGFITVKYTLIRQTAVLDKLRALARGNSKRIRVDSFWRTYGKVNCGSMALCKIIEEYSRFWNVYGTLCFIGHICTVTYQVYALLYLFPKQQMPYYTVPQWITYSLTNMGLLLLYTTVGSSVGKANEAILAEHRKIYWQLCRPLAEKRQYGAMLKVQGMACEGRLAKYSFIIFGSHRITASTFNEIFYFTSAFFFMTVERYRK